MTALSQLEQKIRRGRLLLSLPNGAVHSFGSGEPEAEWVVRMPRALEEIARDPEACLGETCMNRDWDAGDCGLLPPLEVLLRNCPLDRPHGWRLTAHEMR